MHLQRPLYSLPQYRTSGSTSYQRILTVRCRATWPSPPHGNAQFSSSGQLTGAILSFAEVQAVAASRGLFIDRKNLGPFYRISCRQGAANGRLLGVTAGFVAPLFGLMHCDTLQIFTRGLKGQEGQQLRGGPLGLGLLLGGATFAYAHSCGCRKAEILAINDDDAWHERLVRYYRYFGFEPVCTVGGNGWADWPHLLVWGGEGTRMDADVEKMLRKWAPAIRRSAAAAQQRPRQSADANAAASAGRATAAAVPDSSGGSSTHDGGSQPQQGL